MIEALGADPRAEKRLAQARAWIGARGLRDTLLGATLFHNPAWKILLDVYTAHLEGRDASVATVCAQSDVPAATTRRWIAALISMNMLRDLQDNVEPDRAELDLTDLALASMDELFDQLPTG